MVVVKYLPSQLVYLNMYKITNLWKFELNRSSKLRDINERKNTLVTRSCVLPGAWFRDLKIRFWGHKVKHLKAHNFVWQGFFSFHYYLANSTTNWAQTFTGLLFYTCWDTPSEKTGLRQLPIVSSVFNCGALWTQTVQVWPKPGEEKGVTLNVCKLHV